MKLNPHFSDARRAALRRIEEGQKMLNELDAMGKKLEPFSSHLKCSIERVEARWHLRVTRIEISHELAEHMGGVFGRPFFSLWGLPVQPTDGSHFDCYRLILEDGAVVTCGFMAHQEVVEEIAE